MFPVLLQVSAVFQLPTHQASWGQNSSCERSYSLNLEQLPGKGEPRSIFLFAAQPKPFEQDNEQ